MPDLCARLPEYLRHTIYGQFVAKYSTGRQPPDWVTNSLIFEDDDAMDTQEHVFGSKFYSSTLSNCPGDHPMALPVAWDTNKQEVKSTGRTVRISEDIPDNKEIYIQSRVPIPQKCGTWYFEVTFDSLPNPTMIGMGAGPAPHRPISVMGTQNTCWLYFSDDGKVMAESGACHTFGPTFRAGDTIGCGVNYDTRSIFYTKNGLRINTAFKDLPTLELYPFIAVRSGTVFTTNFGQLEFKYDIVAHVLKQKQAIYNEIDQVELDLPDLGTKDPVLQLVSNYLEHMCFHKSSNALLKELGRPQPAEIPEDARLRSSISSRILEQDLEGALELIREHFAEILSEALQFEFDVQIMAKYIRQDKLEAAIKMGDSLKARIPVNREEREPQLRLLFGTLACPRNNGVGAPYEQDLYGPAALSELSTRVVGAILKVQGIQGIEHLPRLLEDLSDLVEKNSASGHINVLRDLEE